MTRPRKEDPKDTPQPLGGGSTHGGSKSKVISDDAELEQHATDADMEDRELSPDEEQLLRREREHQQRRSAT